MWVELTHSLGKSQSYHGPSSTGDSSIVNSMPPEDGDTEQGVEDVISASFTCQVLEDLILDQSQNYCLDFCCAVLFQFSALYLDNEE